MAPGFYHVPKVVKGLILTGDQVISQDRQKSQLRENLPESLCVEMEGASLAQVCYEYEIPFVVIRTVSDYANHEHNTSINIRKFVHEVSGYYSPSIICNMLTFLKSKYSAGTIQNMIKPNIRKISFEEEYQISQMSSHQI